MMPVVAVRDPVEAPTKHWSAKYDSDSLSDFKKDKAAFQTLANREHGSGSASSSSIDSKKGAPGRPHLASSSSSNDSDGSGAHSSMGFQPSQPGTVRSNHSLQAATASGMQHSTSLKATPWSQHTKAEGILPVLISTSAFAKRIAILFYS
jgi:hypothetical protein